MKTRHDGDCSIYASLDNYGVPEAGICTCGYAAQFRDKEDYAEKLYSLELREKLESENKGKIISLDEIIKMMKEGGLKRKVE